MMPWSPTLTTRASLPGQRYNLSLTPSAPFPSVVPTIRFILILRKGMMALQTVVLLVTIFVSFGDHLSLNIHQQNTITLIFWTRLVLDILVTHILPLAFLPASCRIEQ